MRAASLLTQLLQLKQTRVQSVVFDEDGLVAEVCPTTRVPRCGCCGCKARRVHDARRRSWRHLDLAGMTLKLFFTSLGPERTAQLEAVTIDMSGAYIKAGILDGRQVNVARRRLREWIGWALRSRLPPFGKLARTIRQHLEGIVAYVATGMNNGRVEGLNGKARTITRRAYGFHGASSLIGLIFLCCSGLVLTPPHVSPRLP